MYRTEKKKKKNKNRNKNKKHEKVSDSILRSKHKEKKNELSVMFQLIRYRIFAP